MTPATLRVLAIDVGVKHLSCAVLRFPAVRGGEACVDDDAAAFATATLRSAELEEWTVEALTSDSASSSRFSDVLEAAVRFVAARRDLVQRCDAVVLEQQMAPRMRCVAAALFAAARSFGGARVVFQPASAKLAWDAAVFAALAPGARTDSYSRRKTAAVRLCAGLLRAAGQEAASATLAASRKKDDLADALLHGLRFACVERRRRPVSGRKRRLRAPSSPPGRSGGSSSSRSPEDTPPRAAASAPAEA